MATDTASRRRFLQAAGLVTLGAGAAASVGALTDRDQARDRNWDVEADIVIIGFGAAGSSAAIVAKDLGADVLVLETAPPEHAGGDIRVFSGNILSPDDPAGALRYHQALNQGLTVEDAVIRAYVEELCKNAAWLKELGADLFLAGGADFSDFPGADAIKVFMLVATKETPRLHDVLHRAVRKRAIRVMTGTPASRLIQDPSSHEILGVVATSGGREIAVRARKGVLIASGGVQCDLAATQEIAKFPSGSWINMGSPYNTGLGAKMAYSVGAQSWHRDVIGPIFAFRRPEVSFGEFLTFGSDSYLWVGPDGTRFVGETPSGMIGGHGKVKTGGRFLQIAWSWPAFAIFDERMRKAGPISTQKHIMGWGPIVAKDYVWSEDNRAEIEKGWIKTASTVAELAQIIGVDAAALAKTMARWNEHAATNTDPDFGRANCAPVNGPPFYALPLTLGLPGAVGGPKRNAKCQIVDQDDQPIPRLYGAGVLGTFYSVLSPTGSGSGEGMATGRLAARNLVGESRS